MTREEDLRNLVGMLPGGEVVDGNGWPAIVRFNDGLRQVEARLYVSKIGEPGAGAAGDARPRDERRFQNPGVNTPIHLDPGRPTLLFGIADGETVSDEEGAAPMPPVIAAMDAGRHAERDTRVSIQMKVGTLRAAADIGYQTQLKGNGELIVAFRPEYVGAYVEAAMPLAHVGERVMPDEAEEVREAFELLAGVQPPAEADSVAEALGREERRRILAVAQRRARDGRFRRDVIAAYGGRCAMCGLSLGLCVGAHVDPVEADGPDDVRNGISLCPTHHAAFDRHLVRVDEDHGFRLSINERVSRELGEAGLDGGLVGFRDGLFDVLELPADPAQQPHADYFRRRRDYYFPDGEPRPF